MSLLHEPPQTPHDAILVMRTEHATEGGDVDEKLTSGRDLASPSSTLPPHTQLLRCVARVPASCRAKTGGATIFWSGAAASTRRVELSSMGTQPRFGDRSALAVPGHVLTRRASGETVLLNLDTEEYYGLDGVGTRLWELIEGGTTLGQAVGTLLNEFEVTRPVLEADLASVLNELCDCGLVLVENP
jgi:hypothetical protein